MGDWFSPRRGLPAMDGNDPLNNGDNRIQALATALDYDVSYDEGPAGSRPISTPGTPGIAGRQYRTTTGSPVPILEIDTGTGWTPLTLPSFAARPTDSTGTVSTTFGKVAFGTEERDDAGWYTPATSRFTPLVAGVFRISAQVQLATASPGTVRLAVYKNGAILRMIDEQASATVRGCTTVEANGTTDYFEIWALSNAGSRNVYGLDPSGYNSRFEGELVRAA